MRRLAALAAALSLLVGSCATVPDPQYDFTTMAEVQAAVDAGTTYELGPDGGLEWVPAGDRGWRGDCEDFALEKRRQLMARGFERRRLAVWLAYAETGILHAVLVVDGRWVLDQRAPAVTTLAERTGLGYRFVCEATDLRPRVPGGRDLSRC